MIFFFSTNTCIVQLPVMHTSHYATVDALNIRHTAPGDTNHRGTCSRIHRSHTATAAGQSAHSDWQELLRPTPVAASRLSAHAQPEFIPHAETILRNQTPPSRHIKPPRPTAQQTLFEKKNIRKHHRRSASTQHGTRVVQL